jgi:hypothetical protein
MATPPSTNNYTIGKGTLYVAEWSTTGPGAYSEMGNCPSIEMEPSIERLEHYSSRSGLRNRDKYPVIQTSYTLTFDCDEIAAVNLAKFLLGTQSGENILGLQNANQEYALRFVADNPIGVKYTWNFWRCTLGPNGAMALIGDEWQVMSFTAEGLADETNQPTSPYFTATRITTTTTSTTTSTTSSTTTTAP